MGTPPNTSIVLTPAELEFIESQFGGSRSAAIHAALSALMHGGRRSFIAVRQTARGEWLVYENRGGKTAQQFGRFFTEADARRYADDLAAEQRQRNAAAAAPHDNPLEPIDWFEAAETLKPED